MSGISFIKRDWGDVVSIVRIVTTDNQATVSAPNYILNQADNINNANNGGFDWSPSDVVLVYGSDGAEFYNINSPYSSLSATSGSSSQAVVSLTAAQVLGMYAAPVLLVPAPASTKIHILTAAYWDIHWNSAQYASGGVIAIQYDNTVHGGGTAASSTIAAATLNGVNANEVLLFSAPSTIVTSAAIGKGLYLSNATGAFTTGDSASVLNVYYRTIVF